MIVGISNRRYSDYFSFDVHNYVSKFVILK